MQTALLDLYHFGHFALAEAVGRLPSAALRRAAIGALARAAYRLSHEKRRVIERNIAYAFAGRIDPAETRHIAIGCFREFWQEMVEWVPAVGDRLPAAEIEIRGLAHLEQALTGGKGAILWESNGFSRRVQAKRTLHAHGIPLHQTHGETHLGVMWTTPGEGTWLRDRLMRPTYERRESAFVAETLIIPVHSAMATGRDMRSGCGRTRFSAWRATGASPASCIRSSSWASASCSRRARSSWRSWSARRYCRCSGHPPSTDLRPSRSIRRSSLALRATRTPWW